MENGTPVKDHNDCAYVSADQQPELNQLFA
jgi:hypothetical protein